MAYALGRALRSDEHLDHINGVVDDDRLSNLRLLTPEIHGRLHAWLFELAGCRGEDGRFTEYSSRDVTAERAARVGPVVSTREIDPLTWLPVAAHLQEAALGLGLDRSHEAPAPPGEHQSNFKEVTS